MSSGRDASIFRCGTADSTQAGISQNQNMPDYNSTEEDISDTEYVQLQPFIHQVGGHNCVLRFNETTLCKPLIEREHQFYKSIPTELKNFVPDYRGVIEVELQEDDDGQISLIGHRLQVDHPKDEMLESGSQKQTHTTYKQGTFPKSSGSETEIHSPVLSPKNNKLEATSGNTCRDTLGKCSSIRLMRSGSIEVITETDAVFQSPDPKNDQKSAGLNPWSLKCQKRQLAKMRMDNQDSNLKKFILLENVAAKFKCPCILDLKMGTRQHGDDASEAKKSSQMRKCAATTSGAVGLRLIGMQVYQHTSSQFLCQNKYYGRKLSVEAFKQSLELFLFDGDKMRLELLDPILSRLHKLSETVTKQESFRFYSSSLLIMYEGKETTSNLDTHADSSVKSKSGEKSDQVSQSCDPQGQSSSSADDNALIDNSFVDVRMIDFAHSTHHGFRDDELHNGVDQGYVFGLQNLINIFGDIKTRLSS